MPQSSPKGQGNLLGIHGVVGFVVAVGERGKIIHFAGDLYEAKVMGSPTTAHLNAVYVVSERCAWAVGEQGAVLRWDGTAWATVAMGAKDDELFAVWTCRETDGRDSIWIGGRDTLMVYCTATGAQGTLMRTDAILLGIWGSGPDDIWFLCKGRLVLHWNGTGCASYQLPGDEDDEYCAIGGSGPQDPIWVVGVGGIMACGDGEGWEVIDSGTEATLLGVSVAGPDDVWVTTNGGQLRHYDGIGWTTAAFSPFGWLGSLCMVDGVVWCAGAKCVLQHRPEDSRDDE